MALWTGYDVKIHNMRSKKAFISRFKSIETCTCSTEEVNMGQHKKNVAIDKSSYIRQQIIHFLIDTKVLHFKKD